MDATMKQDEIKGWIMIALPGVAIALAYVFILGRPLNRETHRLRARIGQQLAQYGLADKRAERLEHAQSERDRLETQRQAVLASTMTAASPNRTIHSGSARQARALQWVSRVCERHGVTLIYTGPVDRRKKEQAPGMFRLAGWEAPSVWRMEARGEYGRMMALLDALSKDDGAVLPVALEMQPDAGHSLLWTVTFWM
jgi:hypothetical protein